MSENLQQNYEELLRKYETLSGKYESLKSEHEESVMELSVLQDELSGYREEHVKLMQEYSDVKESFEWMRHNEELYRVAMAMTDHVISVVDINQRTLSHVYNEGDYTGITDTMANVPESIIETGIIHPDDCDGFRQFYDLIYSGVPAGEYTLRVMEENRGWVWFNMVYTTTFDEDGRPVRAICFSDDITIKIRAQEKFRQYREAVTADAEYVFELDLTNDRVIEDDSDLKDFIGVEEWESAKQLSMLALAAINDPREKKKVEDVIGIDSMLDAFHRSKKGSIEVSVELPFNLQDGRGDRWFKAVAHIMTNDVEDVIAILCLNDITDSRRDKRQAQKSRFFG